LEETGWTGRANPVSKLSYRHTLLFTGLTALVFVGLAVPAAHFRRLGRNAEREAARQLTPLHCRYCRDHGWHILSFSAVAVDAGFNVVAAGVDQGRQFVNSRPLFGRPAGSLRLADVRLETWCCYNAGRVVPGRLADGRAVFTAVLYFEEAESSTWPDGEPLDVDRFIREKLRPADGPLSP
jgi:hypothetical protein